MPLVVTDVLCNRALVLGFRDLCYYTNKEIRLRQEGRIYLMLFFP